MRTLENQSVSLPVSYHSSNLQQLSKFKKIFSRRSERRKKKYIRPNQNRFQKRQIKVSLPANQRSCIVSKLVTEANRSDLTTKEIESQKQSFMEDRDSINLVKIQPHLKMAQNIQISQEKYIPLLPYIDLIMKYSLSAQSKYIPLPIRNPKIFSSIRFDLINLILKACEKLGFSLETSFLATNIIDRILGIKECSINELPAYAIAALFISSKYEELATHKIDIIIDTMRGCQVNANKILELQKTILLAISFDLSYISPLKFIDYLCFKNNLDINFKKLAQIYAKELLPFIAFRQFRPSIIGLCCLKVVLPRTFSNRNLSQKTNSQLKECLQQFNKIRFYQCKPFPQFVEQR